MHVMRLLRPALEPAGTRKPRCGVVILAAALLSGMAGAGEGLANPRAQADSDARSQVGNQTSPPDNNQTEAFRAMLAAMQDGAGMSQEPQGSAGRKDVLVAKSCHSFITDARSTFLTNTCKEPLLFYLCNDAQCRTIKATYTIGPSYRQVVSEDDRRLVVIACPTNRKLIRRKLLCR